MTIEQLWITCITKALKRANGKRDLAARICGISRRTVDRYIKNHNISHE